MLQNDSYYDRAEGVGLIGEEYDGKGTRVGAMQSSQVGKQVDTLASKPGSVGWSACGLCANAGLVAGTHMGLRRCAVLGNNVCL